MSETPNTAEHPGRELLNRGGMAGNRRILHGYRVAQTLTAISGSSTWFDRGFVSYSNAAKIDMLGVSEATLARHGAVSEATARAMAQGALKNSRGDWAVAITGIAPGLAAATKSR